MRLLFITQIIDKEDDILGFIHRWIEKLSINAEFLNAICLKKGSHCFPSNVKVWSLGKETGESRIKYLLRFYKYIFLGDLEYDIVFIHMNPVYAVLGGLYWKARRKKIFLWYNHHYGSLLARLAILISDKVFYTSPFSFAAKFKKSKIMPAGIDIEAFKRNSGVNRAKNSILSVGRIAPIKKIDVLVKAAKLLDEAGLEFVLNIVGEPAAEERPYFDEVKKLSSSLAVKGKVKFFGKLANYRTPSVYNQNEIFVNLSPSGLFDKAILEAMACEMLTLVSSKAFESVLPNQLIFKEGDPRDLKDKIAGLFYEIPEAKQDLGRKLRDYVIQNHNLDILINKLTDEFKKA
ncbi:MAG: glycosyltransferase family 4 protein [Candidatus Nealsonbacteria bacterium]|nr:glycosyltransferase family 4 protein [Candidatus Nealsonbacteria bacterium]